MNLASAPEFVLAFFILLLFLFKVKAACLSFSRGISGWKAIYLFLESLSVCLPLGWRRERRGRKKSWKWERFADAAVQQQLCRTCYHVKHHLLDALAPLVCFSPICLSPRHALPCSFCLFAILSLCAQHTPTKTHTFFSHFLLLPDLDTSCTFPIQQFFKSPDDTRRFYTS